MSKSAPSNTFDGPAARASSGYRKGEETRARILEAALSEFGMEGFSAVTTRQIADAADVNLPALNYYFGGKEGLYLACAQEIVQRYLEGVGAVGNVARAALAGPLSPREATDLLKRLMAALARFLLSGDAAQRTLFVQREIASPGPAFEILYSGLWRPGIELASELIAAATGGQLTEDEVRIRAVMMISSITGLVKGQDIIVRAAGDSDRTPLVIRVLDHQIETLARLG